MNLPTFTNRNQPNVGILLYSYMDPMGLGDNLKTPKVLRGGINNHE